MKKLLILFAIILVSVPLSAQNFIGLTSLEIKLKMEAEFKDALIKTEMRADTQTFYLPDRILIYVFKRFYCSSYTEIYKDFSTYRKTVKQMKKFYEFEAYLEPEIKNSLKTYCFYERSKMPGSDYRRMLVVYRRYYTITVEKIGNKNL